MKCLHETRRDEGGHVSSFGMIATNTKLRHMRGAFEQYCPYSRRSTIYVGWFGCEIRLIDGSLQAKNIQQLGQSSRRVPAKPTISNS